MKYLWTWGYIYGLWLGCKPPLNIYPSVITSLYGHKMEVSVVILLRPAGPDLWSPVSDVWEDWCHIMVTSSWLMPTVASQLGWAAPVKADSSQNGMRPCVTCHVSRTSEPRVWQRKGENWHHLSWVFAPPFGGVYRYFIGISLAWSRFTPDQDLSWYRGWILTILIATIIRLIINYPPSASLRV